MSEKVGLLVGVGFSPSESEIKTLLENGDLVSGLDYVAIELTEQEAGDEKYLTTMYQGAAVKKGFLQGIHARLTTKKAEINGKTVMIVYPVDTSALGSTDVGETSFQEVCWFCNENPANPANSVKVQVERTTPLGHSKYQDEWKQLDIPRCQRCASLKKKDTRENAMIAIPAMLAGLGTCVIVGVFSSAAEWVSWVSGGCVLLLLFALGIFWSFRRRGRLSEKEKRLLDRVTNSKIETQPLVAAYIKDGFKVKWQKD